MREAKRRQLYDAWVRDHSGELYALAFRLCGEAAQAEDLVQEAFYHAWRSIDELRDPESGRAWLFRILRYRYAHWRRDNARRVQPTVSFDQVEHALPGSGPGILDALSDRDSLQNALDALDDRYKEPFLMVFLQGLTCRETAEALDVPLGTVLSRIHRARAALRKQLDESSGASGERSEPRPTRTDRDGRARPRFRAGGDL